MANEDDITGETEAGGGGELHQTVARGGEALTTNQGVPVADDQNSLKAGPRGPTLLEDFHFREKITHFDHERIPERVVHARGHGAHGYFQPYQSWAHLTKAAFLQDPTEKTPVFVRFSTVAGGAGSVDLPRDVRGFAVKLYTREGNYDLVGNNIPVFFIQDAIKFPDLIHAVKMEPDRGYPQAATAHDTFWDFVSLMPESLHMILWAMSDRTLPRSVRMMEGFGIHTFRFVNAAGEATFVKFHWRPTIGSQSVVWDEAVKISGADPDFHRRDLFDAIARGDFPEWEFSVQAFDEETAAKLPFDVLDPTKLVPEEVVPLLPLGKMVLDRNPDNFFAETEQAAFHPGHVVPGIDFTDDPLLQGRLFSYLDTQLSRLGGPNFHQIPINAPKCPMRNFQRDALHQMTQPKGQVGYEPNSLGGPRESPAKGYTTYPKTDTGPKVRERAATFSDHYSQARLFFRSMSEPEQAHIVAAFAFELGKCQPRIRRRMLGHLALVAPELETEVAAKLGMEGEAEPVSPARPPVDLPPSPALSLVKKAQRSLRGRTIGVLLGDGFDDAILDTLRKDVAVEGGQVQTVALKVGGALGKSGAKVAPDHALAGGPSVFFDAVLVLASELGLAHLTRQAAATDWIRDAYAHLKVIGHTAATNEWLEDAGVERDAGVVLVDQPSDVAAFVVAARGPRLFDREPKVRP